MFNKQVKCEECKHYVDKSDAQEVPWYMDSFIYPPSRIWYFCPIHKKPYDKCADLWGSSERTFYRSVKVDGKTGKPI